MTRTLIAATRGKSQWIQHLGVHLANSESKAWPYRSPVAFPPERRDDTAADDYLIGSVQTDDELGCYWTHPLDASTTPQAENWPKVRP